MQKIIINVAVVAVLALGAVRAIEDDCKKFTFNVTGAHMQLVKEITHAEYAINGMPKALHCCARNYRSIEWMKDNKPYPFKSSGSGLILYPENANQTIYTQHVSPEDAGTYKCVVRNDTDYFEYAITLEVADKAPDEPKLTYLSQDQEVYVGHSVRLFCEAFVGAADHLPDAINDAYWERILPNGTLIRHDKRMKSETISREENQTSGAYLIIDEVLPEDFGTYMCTIKKPGNEFQRMVHVREKAQVDFLAPNPIPWRHLLSLSLICALMALTLYILNRRFGLLLRVSFKDRFGHLERNDGKTSDVLLAYTAADAAFAIETLLPTLEHKFHYVCSSRELSTNTSLWSSQLMDVASKSRRLIAILSPASVGQWECTKLYETLKQLNSLNTQFTCVMMADPPRNHPQPKNDQGETFASLYRQVVHVRWHGSEAAERFWLTLRLYLPPTQFTDLQTMDMTQSNVRRLTATDEDHAMDGLV